MSTLYNVTVPVVELVIAESRDAAVKVLVHKLSAAGFEPYTEGSLEVVESEPVECGTCGTLYGEMGHAAEPCDPWRS